jgi:hypothetical protein
MAMIRKTLEAGKELSFDEREAARRRIEAASRRPYVYDPDCPLLTEEQLAEFHPVNGMTWEDRNRLMYGRGIKSAETIPAPAMAGV